MVSQVHMAAHSIAASLHYAPANSFCTVLSMLKEQLRDRP